jgi:hypothetical protein
MWITVATPPFTDIALFDRIATEMSPPEGMLARYAGTADDGKLRVVVLWESREHAERFLVENLGPALARVLGPEPAGRPTALGINVERVFTTQSVS